MSSNVAAGSRTLVLDATPASTLDLDATPASTLALDATPASTLALDATPASTLAWSTPTVTIATGIVSVATLPVFYSDLTELFYSDGTAVEYAT